MARYDNFYSNFVAWMKIILPLAALALLSTLFLISRTIDPTSTIPIAQIDLKQRAQDLGVTNPTFAGVSDNGTEIMLKARLARPDPKDKEHLLADDVSLQLRLVSGTIIDITSDNADLHQAGQTANLDGNVHVTTNSGYQIDTEAVVSRLDRLYAETPGAISGNGPEGEFWAGRMLLTADKATGHTQLLFTEGVRLLYTPQATKE